MQEKEVPPNFSYDPESSFAEIVEEEDSSTYTYELGQSLEEAGPFEVLLRQVKDEKLLTHEEEMELGERIEAGLVAERFMENQGLPDYITQPYRENEMGKEMLQEDLAEIAEQGNQAKKELFTHNLKLVYSVVRKYSNSKIPKEDLVHEGAIALMHAIEKYDYQKGNKFSTYATWWIRQGVSKAIADKERLIRIPSDPLQDMAKIENARTTLREELTREPVPEEIADKIGKDVSEVRELQILNHPVPLSLETDNDDEKSLIEKVGINEKTDDEPPFSKEILKFMDETLTKEQKIVVCEVFKGTSEEDIALIIGASDPKKVKSIYGWGIRKLRKAARPDS